MSYGGPDHGGVTHHVSYGVQKCGECGSYHGGGHALCSGCDGSLHDGGGHNCQYGGGHDDHAHDNCYADVCDGGDGLSNGCCGARV